MSNNIILTTDLGHAILLDERQAGHKYPLTSRGVLISQLGRELCLAECPESMDAYLASDTIRQLKPFFRLELDDPGRRHLSVSFNETSQTVFIIGIRDIDISLAGPTLLDNSKTESVAVRLRDPSDSHPAGRFLILARMDVMSRTGGTRVLQFYLLPAR